MNPPFTEYGGLEGHGGKSAPINLGYLAAYLREKSSHSCKILDAEALELSYEMVEKEIRKINPDIIAMTAPTPAFQQVIDIANIIKNKISKDIIIIVGGPHPSVFPEETIKIEPIDFIVAGEGEITFYELVEALDKKKDLHEVAGIVFMDNGRIIKTRPREFINNLDILPFPARDLMPQHLYAAPPTKKVSEFHGTSIVSSRGCPFNCTYCIPNVIWKRRYRARSPKNLVDEIETCVKKYNLREFNFHDELFTTLKERTIEICREIKKRKLNIAWVCMSRTDFVPEDVLREMKSAGCKKIMFGIESGSKDILRAMRKNVNLEQAKEAVKLVKKVGIDVAVNFMFGYIGETEETIRQSIRLAKELDADTTAFLVASPYPGTDFYNIAKEKGYFREGYDWKDFTLVSKDNVPVLNLPGLDAERVLYWQKRAYREYYLRPKYILRKIGGIRSLGDLKNLFGGLKLFFRIQ